MTINKRLCPSGLKNNPNKSMKAVNYITIHNTGNYAASATAKSHADYQFGGSGGAQTSWHYSVDGKEIWQSFNDNQMCWHAGDGNGPGNSESIGIEICVNDKAAFKKACENAAWLVSELLKKYNLPADRIVQHNRWSGKNCPSEIRSGSWGVNWDGFTGMVKQYLNDAPKTAIAGTAVMTSGQLTAYFLKNNPSPKINCAAAELAALFIEEGAVEGIRGDLAFCQSLHETGWFKYGGQVLPEQNNYAGIGAVNGSATGKGAWFDTPQIGVRAQIQHLKAYANKEALKNPCVDPRFQLVSRGCAPNWEDLNGRWAVPGDGYGQSILKLYEAGKGTVANDTETDVKGAIATLVKHGVISTPDYWLANYGKLQYLDKLLINMANKITA